MGTRNLTMVRNKNGELKVAQYGQWDGYPSGQGITILNFCSDELKRKALETKIDDLKFWNECEELKEYLEEYDKRAPKFSNEPDNRTKEDKYWWDTTQTRDLGGEILESIISLNTNLLPKEMNGIIYLKDSSEFLNDDLFCEWAYCVNFKTNKLEVYCNGNKLIKEYDLNNLPTEDEFIDELKEEE